jgi:predicted ATPase
VETELVYQRGLPPQTRYLFKHALIQDAAYQSLLKSKRQQYHKQIVQVLEERFPETKETQPELLAHHYTEASLIAQAIPYWQQAGERAVERSANVEAIGPLTRGLELLKTLPVTPERTQQELTLQITLGVPLIHIKGYAAPEVERTYTRARGLCQQVGETPQLFSALWGLWLFYVCAGGHETARELGEQLLSLAQRVHDPAPVAHYALGCSLFLLGELAQGREHLEQGIALYHPQSHRSYAFLYSQDPRVVCSSYAAWSPWCLGYPDQALKRNTDMLTFAQELAHPFSLAFALNFAAALYQFRGEGQAAQERADAAIALCAEQGFPFWLAMGTILQGWVLAEQGQAEKGIAQIRHGLTSYRATGAELFRPHFLALLAEACGKGGRTEEGLTALAEALAMVHQNGERYYEAELYRLKGELSLQSGVRSLQSEITSPQLPIPNPRAEAEACFLKAIEIAQRQQAKSLELRAVMSLSRLWQQQGRKDEARQMLAEIYGWFTEGFDTADLKEAKVLLEGLAR